MRWHRSAPGRDDATAALLNVVRFPLLSVATLRALRSIEGLTGLPGMVVSRLAAAALTSHCGPSRASTCEPPLVRQREAFPFWWADFGCSIRGGSVAVDSAAAPQGKRNPHRVQVHDGALYILFSTCLLQWPLGDPDCVGHVIAKEGRALDGVGALASLTDFAIDAAGDIYILDALEGRVIKIHDGVGEVVGEGKPRVCFWMSRVRASQQSSGSRG